MRHPSTAFELDERLPFVQDTLSGKHYMQPPGQHEKEWAAAAGALLRLLSI